MTRREGSPAQVTYSFDVPRPEEFKALYDGTGWGDFSLDVFQRALHGSWLVASARQGDTLIGMGRVISDGVLHAFVTEMIVQLPRAPPCRDRPTRSCPPVTGSSSQHPNGC